MRGRDLLLHPIALAAIALLIVNDHVLKEHFAGFWTGKLSDVAGMIVFPLLLLAVIDEIVAIPRPRRRASVVLAVGLTAVVFALVKCVPTATEAYRVGLGVLQTPFRGSFSRVSAVTDPTDLAAIPFALLGLIPARRWLRACRDEGGASQSRFSMLRG